MGVMVSSSRVLSTAPSSSLYFCSSVGCLPWETALCKLLQCDSCPQIAEEVLECGFFTRGEVLQEQGAPAWVPHGVTSPARKSAPAWAPLSMGPQVLPGTCSSVGSPWGHSLLQACPPAVVWGPPWSAGGYLLHSGPPWAAKGQPASPWSSP